MKLRLLFIGFVLSLLTTKANAIPINVQFVSQYQPGSIMSLNVDQQTGQYWERRGFNGQTFFNVYSSYNDFAVRNAAFGYALNDPGYYGSYAAVKDGQLFGRLGPMDQRYGRWDIGTGQLTASTALTNFEPQNGYGTFNWGGYSGLNTYNNGTNTYVVGGQIGTSDWRVEQIDENLNNSFVGNMTASSSTLFAGQPTFGLGFLIGNYLFMGDSYNSGQISTRFNVLTGVQDVVDFQLTGFNNSLFLNNMVYDQFSDRLVIWNNSNRTYWSLDNAAAAFGVDPSIQVPAPGQLSLLLLGTLALMGIRGRKS
ncbi:MAG: hypothetical protein AAF529_17290 [Pseudomonadota bacterium]